MTEFLQRLSQMIRDKRKELSISQEKLAEKVGVTPSFVGQVERGESLPSVETLFAFVRFLNLDVNSLFFGVCSMADKDKYSNKIQGKMVDVSEDVYYAYFRMERQERWQEEKKEAHKVLSYDALDNQEMLGIENVVDVTAPTLEEIVEAHELREMVRHAVELLLKVERELIRDIYYEELPERDVAEAKGVSQNKVFKQRQKALAKLKMLLEITRIF